jgi:hypothetical protein
MTTKENKTIERLQDDASVEDDVLCDPKYILSSCKIITDALKEGGDVVQMPNGDIIIREQKTVTTKYSWHAAKEKIVKLATEIDSPIKES